MMLVLFLLPLLMEKPRSHICIHEVNCGCHLVTSGSLDPWQSDGYVQRCILESGCVD